MDESPKAKHPLDRYDNSSPTHRPFIPGELEVVPHNDRHVTDIYCLLLFVICNVCLWTLSGWSYQEGNPQRLVHGWDLHGDLCGVGELWDFPFTYFPFPTEEIDVSWCLAGCPVVKAQQSLCPYDENQLPTKRYGCYDAYPSRPFYNNYCLPADASQRTAVLQWLYDRDQAWDLLAVAGVVAFLTMTCYCFSFKLRCKDYADCAIPCYCVSMFVVMFLFAVLVYLLHEENWRVNGQMCQPFGPVRMDECDEGDLVHGYRDLAWATAAVGFCAGIAMLLMLPRLYSGHKIFMAASEAFGGNPIACICPFFAVIIGVALYAYFITLLLFSTSVGEHSTVSNVYSPWGTIEEWEFNMPERILVAFEVGMILWWFSFLAHAVEYVTAHATGLWYFNIGGRGTRGFVQEAVHCFFRYHIGSVLFASIFVPVGRLFRNLISAFRFLLRKCSPDSGSLAFSMNCCRPLLFAYKHWFKLCTADGLAYQSLRGESYIQSAKSGYDKVKNGDIEFRSQAVLNCGNMIVWLLQLAISMSGVVFCAWWLQFYEETFRGVRSYKVTSVTAMACYELVISWFLAQVFGAFVRGVMHAGVQAVLIDREMNKSKTFRNNPFTKYLDENRPTTLDTEWIDTTKAKDITKVTPAPVADLIIKAGPSGQAAQPGDNYLPHTAMEGLREPELVPDIKRVPNTAPLFPAQQPPVEKSLEVHT